MLRTPRDAVPLVERPTGGAPLSLQPLAGATRLLGDEPTRLDALVMFDVVYLARHGQTRWNQEGRKQGQLDSPLTLRGQQHAVDLARVAGTLDVDLVASSPIGRALVTAQACADVAGRMVRVVDELAEVHHGGMAGLTTAEADVQFPGELEKRVLDKYQWRFPWR